MKGYMYRKCENSIFTVFVKYLGEPYCHLTYLAGN